MDIQGMNGVGLNLNFYHLVQDPRITIFIIHITLETMAHSLSYGIVYLQLTLNTSNTKLKFKIKNKYLQLLIQKQER